MIIYPLRGNYISFVVNVLRETLVDNNYDVFYLQINK